MKIERSFDQTDTDLTVVRAELIVINHAIHNFKLNTLLRPISPEMALERSFALARFNKSRDAVLFQESKLRQDYEDQDTFEKRRNDSEKAVEEARNGDFSLLRSHVNFSASLDGDSSMAYRTLRKDREADLYARFSANWLRIARWLPE